MLVGTIKGQRFVANVSNEQEAKALALPGASG